MSLRANGSKLQAVTRELANQWQLTRESWRDVKSLEFEQKYIAELLAGVDRALTVIEQLDRIIAKIRSDCE
jgi:hypothetical protein